MRKPNGFGVASRRRRRRSHRAGHAIPPADRRVADRCCSPCRRHAPRSRDRPARPRQRSPPRRAASIPASAAPAVDPPAPDPGDVHLQRSLAQCAFCHAVVRLPPIRSCHNPWIPRRGRPPPSADRPRQAPTDRQARPRLSKKRRVCGRKAFWRPKKHLSSRAGIVANGREQSASRNAGLSSLRPISRTATATHSGPGARQQPAQAGVERTRSSRDFSAMPVAKAAETSSGARPARPSRAGRRRAPARRQTA